ncbi:GTPase [Hyphomicrobium sp.]|uniref:GTPase family protein n=1 Tax=Hyphomicrobium sp. TaxID=82 RepID=UPI0025BDCF01|nr:GTPase [Hyphomicrobium sp.]MCC7251443.1 50S ribosome-binding GTPase [Hyphomicrobium sp.]
MSDKPIAPPRARRTASLILIAIGLLVPALSLIPLGSIWLWQSGYLLYWTAFALAAVALVYLAQRHLLPEPGAPPAPVEEQPTEDDRGDDDALRFGWSPLEEQAWSDVRVLARGTDPDRITSPEALLALGRETIEIVARRVHAGRQDPVWQFTTPEALAIIERVARRLRMFVRESVPFGDRLTVAQALTLYRWRGALDWAERAYDVWRVVRLANPATAAANEAREQLSKAMMQWGRDTVSRKLTEAYVLEIGRAAIDLYGGRLRVSTEALSGYVSEETAADQAAVSQTRTEPLRILVAGQTGVGKSSLVNALAKEARAATDALPATSAFTPYMLEREGLPAALVVDSPGLGTDPKTLEALLEKAADSDLVLWVVAAHRADRELDRKALAALRAHFAARLNRRRPPLVLVATHIDRLRPFGEWSPPYDLAAGNDEKARNIRDAIAAASADLGFAADEAVAVSLADPETPYNVERLWERIADALPEAMRAQLLRCLHELRDTWSWRSVWSQAAGAGRTIAGALRKESPRSGGPRDKKGKSASNAE